MQLIEGKKYLIWGQYEAEYIGSLEMGIAGLQHRFKRDDGWGVICVEPKKSRLEVSEK